MTQATLADCKARLLSKVLAEHPDKLAGSAIRVLCLSISVLALTTAQFLEAKS
jgi:hypothetical protein